MSRYLRIAAAALGAAAAVAVAVATPAYAVGTGGVELTPLSGGGQQVSSFHVHLAPGQSSTQHFLLRNEKSSSAQFSLYAANVIKSKSGDFTVDGPGTAPWIGVKTQTVTLRGGESRSISFTVRRSHDQHGPVAYGAVVVAMTDQMVVSRAAAMVYVERPGADPVQRALLPIGIAATVIAAGVAAQARVRRRRRGALT